MTCAKLWRLHFVILSTSINYTAARPIMKFSTHLIHNTVVNSDYVFSKDEVINV